MTHTANPITPNRSGIRQADLASGGMLDQNRVDTLLGSKDLVATTPHLTTLLKSETHHWANALASGCVLDEYRIDSILGAGGFGVTYKAWDSHLETWVAIKEYFPVEWSFRDGDGVTVHPNTQGSAVSGNEEQVSDYLWGLERFLDEARVLARIQHPFVVRVKRYFRAHGTAYIVMEYEEGEPLSAILQDGETLGEDEVRGLLEDVLPALQAVHEQGYLHRDIKPSNLYVRSSDHRVILIDFGAARAAVGRHSKSVTSLVTPGYSPPEQYTTRNDRYGGWTDLYALGAVLYRCVTGHAPTEAAERLLEDHQEPAVRACAGRYGTPLLQVIDRALAVRPEQRFQTVAEMQAALCEAGDESSDEMVILLPPTQSARGSETPRPTGPPSCRWWSGWPTGTAWKSRHLAPQADSKPTRDGMRCVRRQTPTRLSDAAGWKR
ncbi:MAG: serine/threonine protein kinase [Sphingobacterium sp.]|nr:serine/threonine protein kinase [Sphingobacterium sp.]